MATRLQETEEQIQGDIERVRSLVAAGQHEEARDISAATQRLIDALRSKTKKKRYNEELEEAGTPLREEGLLTPVALPEVTDYTKIEGVPQLVAEIGEAMTEGFDNQAKALDFSKRMARRILDLRLSIVNRKGVPDLFSNTQAARDAAKAAYAIAGKHYREAHPDMSEDDAQDVVEALMVSVWNQWSEVLVNFLDNLDTEPELATKHFPMALDAYPDETPSRAVRALYKDVGQPLPLMGRNTKRRLERALERARKNGDEKKVAELEQKLGLDQKQQEELPANPEATANTFVGQLRRDIKAAEALVPLIPELPEDARKELREAAEEAVTTAKQIVAETL
ncbi:hypothetical protein ACFPA8_07905 [Streptomyces ovatisporus]|uniref:Uncharacterized protein n=1 Tax=Streptomyces ovatisporus TaxID=1128682 RepID=A0ABV9A521_9ACTN